MMTRSSRFFTATRRALAVAALLPSLVLVNASAADRTWDGEGSDNNWLTGPNWDPIAGGTAPVANDLLLFDGGVRTSPVNNFAAGTSFQGIGFNAGASAFTLGGNSVMLGTPASATYGAGLSAEFLGGSIVNISPNLAAINLSLILTNGHHNFNSSGTTLNLAGSITLSPGASAAFTTGINTTGSGLANLNGILGGWATMIPPSTWAALDGSGNIVGFTAFADVGAGETIASVSANNVRLTSGGATNALAAAGVTDINSLFMGDVGANQVVDVAAGRILRFGSKGGILNASRTIGTSRILTIGVATGVGAVTAGGADNTPGDLYLIETPLIGNTGNQLVMNSRITNNGSAAVTVHAFGHVSYPNVAHTYSGGTYIHGGRIQTLPNILGSGPIYVYPGGQLFFNGNGTCTNAIFMAGYGNGESIGNGAIRMGGTGRIITGLVTLLGDAATANGTINGRITGAGRLIVGAGNGNGIGTLIIGATNDYSGDTLINGTNATAASTLQMTSGRPHTMPHGAGKGNLILRGISPTVAATFNLNGTDQTVNGLGSMDTEANTFVNSGVAGPATLIVGDGDASGNFAGVIQNGSGAVGLAKIGAGTQILRGPNTYTNGTTVNGGKLVFGAPGSFPAGGAVTVNNNAILDVSAVSPLTLGASQPLTSSNGTLVLALQSAGNAVTTPTLNSLGGTNYITVTDIPSISTYPAQFTAIKYTTLNGALNFGLAGPLPTSPGTPFAAYVSNNVANGSVDVVVTAGPASLIWLGYSSGAPNSSWDTSTPNWITLGGPPTVYSDGSFVNFMDVASNGVATLNQSVSPAGMTVSNNSLTITFNGGGAIGGTGGLAKRGPGTLILDNAGANTFSGPIAINGGTLQIGNNDSGGSLPAFTPVNNNGALIFARNDVITISNAISGNGTLLQNGSGSVTLSAANTFSGAATVVQGTLILDNNSALGATNAGTTVATGATLDVGSPTLPQDAVSVFEPIFVAGAGVGGLGAIVNNSATRQLNALKFVTLTNNTVFGGSGRWDIRATGGTTGNPTGARLSTGNQPYSLVKTGANTVIIVSATVDPALADIDVRQGQFQIEGNTTSLGNPNNNLIVQLGATLSFFNVTNLMNKNFLLNGDGVATTVLNDSGNNTVIGPMTLNGGCIFDSDAGTSLVLNNTITGAGSLTKVDTGSLTFSGSSSNFAGSLRVNGGAVTLSGTLSNAGGVYVAGGKFVLNGTLLGTLGGVTNDPGSTLAGGGTTPALVSALGQVSPGDTNGVVGTLTVGTLQLEGGASVDFDLNSLNTVGSGTNDLIVVNGNLTVNGNSITINPLGPLQKGPTHPYRLFNYTGSLIWNGDLSVSGPNNYAFAVDTNTPGQINVIASGGPPVWDGGSATVNNWSDAANWGGIAINPGNTLYFAGNNRLNNTNDTTANTSYTDLAFSFDSGQFILNGNPVYLTGNVANNSTNAERVAIGISYGDNRTFTGNSGPLVIGGGVTNTVSLTTLTLAGNGILTNIVGTATGGETNSVLLTSSNANWTLVDNASSATMTVPWVLNVNNGTFNFGVGSSAPRLTSTSVNGQPQDHIVGATPNSVAIFNMSNGVFTTSARLNTGTAGGATGIVNQVGGTMNIGSQLQGANGAATAVSFVNVSGGTMNIIDTQLRTLFVASRGPGVLNVSGSGVINCGALDVSRSINSGIPGTVNLDGGTLSVSRVGTATANSGATTTGSTATFNFNGGTLKANASSATWFQGNLASPAVPITANVKAGGAVIDTDTNAVTVLEPLRHDSALGGTPDGGLSKLGSGTLTLPIVSTYTGPTVVNAGTLLLSGSLPTSAVTVNGGVLSGNGICGSTLTVSAGGTVSPGTSAGILTVTNAVTLGGVAHMEVHPALGTNDLLRSITANINYGGTLRVTNLGGVFLNGSSFKLFNAGGGSYLNGFTTFQLPGLSAGQSWNTSQLTVNGTLSVVGNPAPPSITTVVPSGGNLLISGGNGVTNGNFQVFSSTNVAAALSTWTLVGAGQFDSNGNFSFLMPIEVGTAQRFFVLRLQ